MNSRELVQRANDKILKIKLKGKKYSPEILLALGIAGVVTGTVLACVSTTRLPEIKKKKEEELSDMHERLDGSDSEEAEANLPALKKETTSIYFRAGLRYASLYAPSVLVTGVSVSCLVASNVILRRRLIGVSAAYAAVSKSFKEYRNRVAERYGEEIEREIRYNIQSEDISKTTVNPKTGKEKTTTETVKFVNPNDVSDFARVYDDGNIGWTKDPMANLTFLKAQQAVADQLLKKQGYLFINDVYDMLGFPKCKEGQVAGWIYDEKNPIGDNFVDFGIYDTSKPSVVNFINGYERSIILDFNIDGNILEYI